MTIEAPQLLSPRASHIEADEQRDPADTGRRLPDDFEQKETKITKSEAFVPFVTFCENENEFPAETSSGFWEQEARDGATVSGRMVPGEIPGPGIVSPHETRQPQNVAVQAPPAAPRALANPRSESGKRTRNQRLQVLRAVAAVLEQRQCREREACLEVGVDQATYGRWRDAWKEYGDDGLIPGYDRCGNTSSWERYVPENLRPWLIERLQYLNGKIGDASTAVRVVAEEPDCPPGLAVYLRTLSRFPKSILRAAHINPQIRSKFKGPRNYQLNSIVNIRTMTEIINGAEVPINPGDWWELDDMSLNQPFWFEIPDGDHPDWRGCTVDGIALGRQGLYAMDLASGKWLGPMLVGRPKDAYRAEDILRYLHLLMKEWGKPRRGLRLERGIWRSTRITGYKLRAEYGKWDGENTQRPGMEESEQEALVACIKQLGIEVAYCYSPLQKGAIEGGFRDLQKYMSATEWTDIGRVRGENELATKALMAAKSGRTHPAAKGFAHIEQAANALIWAGSFINTHYKNGRLQRGIPDERWVASEVRHGKLAALTRDEEAVFLPERRTLQIRGGHVTPEYAGQPFPFIAPELFADVGNGYRVLVAFDPSNPQIGAGIWNNETGMINRQGWKLGQFLGWADYDAPAPQFGVREEGRSDHRKRYLNWHRTVFVAIKNFGGEARRESAARDGRGNAVELTKAAAALPAISAGPKAEAAKLSLPPRQARDTAAPMRQRDSFAEMFGDLNP